MKKVTHSEILRERLTPEEALKSKRTPISLILSDIRSKYNVGSIFRTSDSALIEEIILCGFTPVPPDKEIEKTALGAVETVKWSYEKNAIKAVENQKKKGFRVYALELTDKKRRYDSLTEKDYPLCLVLGNELTGIDDEVLNACDDAIEIPMKGVKHSLNVAVATGVAVFEALRIWEKISSSKRSS